MSGTIVIVHKIADNAMETRLAAPNSPWKIGGPKKATDGKLVVFFYNKVPPGAKLPALQALYKSW